MQQVQLGTFFGALAAWVVCGWIPKRMLPSLRVVVPDEHQPGCFALEEERGGKWTGSGVPIINEVRPTL
jgi:hypothetical protein